MTKRIIYLLFIFLPLVGCSERNQVSEFESILGKEKSEALTKLVSDFEKDFLKTNYPDLKTEEAYYAFLFDVKYSDFEYWKKIDDNLKNRFKESHLNIDIYKIPDSVWIEKTNGNATQWPNEQFIIRRKYLDSTGTIKNMLSSAENFGSNLTVDTILRRTRNYSEINLEGRYSRALEKISERSEFLTDYVDRRKVAGKVSPEVLINLMADYKVDVNDYFMKRIIVVDILF